MLFLFWNFTKSTIFVLIPLLNGEIGPFIFVVIAITIIVVIIGSNPLGEPLFLSLFILNSINKFRRQLEVPLILKYQIFKTNLVETRISLTYFKK